MTQLLGDEYRGQIEYNHNTDVLKIYAGASNKLTLNSSLGKTVDITGNIFASGVATATAFHGDGSNLTNLPAAGITTEAGSASGIVTHVRLSSAQDHKITATGFTTITSSGEEQRENHILFVL